MTYPPHPNHPDREVTARLEQRALMAARLRRAIRDPDALASEAERLLARVPEDCDVLVAWSNEGLAVGAAAAVLARGAGRRLGLERASHLQPLAPSPADLWRWVNVEQALGLGDIRPWAKHWAEQRGGRLLEVEARAVRPLVGRLAQ